jgi:hypothetical protein
MASVQQQHLHSIIIALHLSVFCCACVAACCQGSDRNCCTVPEVASRRSCKVCDLVRKLCLRCCCKLVTPAAAAHCLACWKHQPLVADMQILARSRCISPTSPGRGGGGGGKSADTTRKELAGPMGPGTPPCLSMPSGWTPPGSFMDVLHNVENNILNANGMVLLGPLCLADPLSVIKKVIATTH